MVEETTLEPVAGKDKLVFTHWPEYARFIRDNHLLEYIRYQLKGARELNTPLLKIFGDMSDEQIIELSIPGHIEFLTAAEENKLGEMLSESMKKWVENRLEIVGRDEIEAEDITQVGYLRKAALTHFLPLYTNDIDKALSIVKEIDIYLLESDTVGVNTYIDILQNRIAQHTKALKESEEQLLEAQKIADLGSFDWDLISKRINVSPQLMTVLDIDHTGDFEYFIKKVHPADKAKVIAAMENAYQNGEYECEYRLATRDGKERIIWSRGWVSFADSTPVNFKGMVMDVTEKHHMVQRLQRSEDLYKQAQALSHIGNWAWDLIHQRLTWSDELYRIYDMEIGSEIDYDSIQRFNHPDDNDSIAAAMAAAMRDHKPFDFFYRITSNTGKQKILHARGEVLTYEGAPYKLIGTLQDVTERQNIMERLQRSDYLYKQAQALSHIGNWTWDIATNKITWTEELYRIFGLGNTTEEITFDKYLSFIHPEDREMLMGHVQQTMETHEPYDFYHRAIMPDGTIRYIQSRGEVLLDEQGQPYQMMGTGQDVTRQQIAERQLRASQEFIQKIADTTPSLIASYNIKTGEYTFINKALYTILGYDPEEAIKGGLDFFVSIVHPDDLGPIIEKNQAALEIANSNPPPADGTEMIAEFKYRMRHKDGAYHWFHTFGTIFDRDKEGKVEHLLNVSIDITEQEEAEQALQQRNIELQQSNASLEEYAYVASHDLKEPLRKIITFSDRLMTAQYDVLSENGRLYLDKIMDSSRRMQIMISDLLSVSVISGNKAFEPTDLKALLDDVLQTLEFKIEERNADVESSQLPVMRVVPSQFRQLFLNLIGNSLKFVKEDIKPEIKITHSYLQPADVRQYKLTKATRYLRIDVSDNGIGFDNQYSNKIFTIFQRLHGKTEYEGTGIGLAICRKVAENHGGTIIATGAINQGSTFTIIIPA